jgi:hypothetical protein
MSKKKSNPLKAFIEKLCDVSVLNDTSFNDLYPWYFEDIARDLREEIIFNLSNLSKVKFDTYIRYVKDELDNNYYYDPDVCIIEKWLKKFDLIESDFPFYFDEKVTQLISYDKDNTSLEFEEAKMARSIQLEFYWFAVFLEANKMIAFVNSFFLNDFTESGKIEEDNINKIELNPIFKSIEGFKIFSDLLVHLGVNMSTIKNRGIIARLEAIWREPTARKIIFKEIIELKDYVDYLNEAFGLTLKSRSISKGDNYHQMIKNWLEQYE